MLDDNEPSVDCVHAEDEEGARKKDDQEMDPILFSDVRENKGPSDGVRVESEVEGASKKDDRLEDSSPSEGKKDNVTTAPHGDQAKLKGGYAPTKEDTESEKKIKEELDSDNVGNYMNLTLMVSNATLLREVCDKGPNGYLVFYALTLSLLLVSVVMQLCSAFLRLYACVCCRSGTCDDEEKGSKVDKRPKSNSTALGLLALLTVFANIAVAGLSPTSDDHLSSFSNVTSQT